MVSLCCCCCRKGRDEQQDDTSSARLLSKDDDSTDDDFIPVVQEEISDNSDSYFWEKTKYSKANWDCFFDGSRKLVESTDEDSNNNSDEDNSDDNASQESNKGENFFDLNVSLSMQAKKRITQREKKQKAEIKLDFIVDPNKFLQFYPEINTDSIPSHIDGKCQNVYNALKLDPQFRDRNLIALFSSMKTVDRHFIAKSYEKKYGVSLCHQIKKIVSPSLPNVGYLLCLLSFPIEEAEAWIIYNFFEGKKSKNKEEHLFHVLCGRSYKEIRKLCETYVEKYHTDLDVQIMESVKNKLLRKYIILCMGIVEEYDQEHRHTKEKVKEQTQILYENGEGKKFGVNEEVLFDVLCSGCILLNFFFNSFLSLI